MHISWLRSSVDSSFSLVKSVWIPKLGITNELTRKSIKRFLKPFDLSLCKQIMYRQAHHTRRISSLKVLLCVKKSSYDEVHNNYRRLSSEKSWAGIDSKSALLDRSIIQLIVNLAFIGRHPKSLSWEFTSPLLRHRNGSCCVCVCVCRVMSYF